MSDRGDVWSALDAKKSNFFANKIDKWSINWSNEVEGLRNYSVEAHVGPAKILK